MLLYSIKIYYLCGRLFNVTLFIMQVIIRTDEDGYKSFDFLALTHVNGEPHYASTVAPENLEGVDYEVVHNYHFGESKKDVEYILAIGGQLYPARYVVYEYDRCYGGPEEGGWWYDFLYNPQVVCVEDFVMIEAEQAQISHSNRQFVCVREFVGGESETKTKPHYC